MEGGKHQSYMRGNSQLSGVQTGVYTDTDTACVRPLRDWPGIARHHVDETIKTDSTLSLLSSMPGLLASAPRDTGEETVEDLAERMARMEQWEPPKLIIALEHDHWKSGVQNWREAGHSRGMQFVQVGLARLCMAVEISS